ncbi:putative secreted protein [Streptomyces davaonensis JCM 4913]|uniref:Putative secreted protein n=1 Tax=Streptomyces davaonensis (strain DSM 101723 / JCM 4913 / KCC S-0913 / 768) TaxID=1214101 RepID=K4R9R7_STRDJ|nr:hypothetical protein [Streptomyces davaonensis]CCK29872.1 putative secreted protein [Streptomyces davaonensis JCM 4913]
MRTLAKALTVASAAGLLMFSGTPANATQQDEDNYWLGCQSYNDFKFRLYYNSNSGGAWRDFGYSVGNFGAVEIYGSGTVAYKFCGGTGNGALQGVKNNAASARNEHTSYGACVYYNSWFNGAKDGLQPATPTPVSKNLVNTYNENASFQWC